MDKNIGHHPKKKKRNVKSVPTSMFFTSTLKEIMDPTHQRHFWYAGCKAMNKTRDFYLWRVPPGRVLDGMSASIRYRPISINPVIYLKKLLCLQVYLFWCGATFQPFSHMVCSFLSSTLQFSACL